jgi:hypothetical protein
LDTPPPGTPVRNLYLRTRIGVLDILTEVLGVGDFARLKSSAQPVLIGGKPVLVIALDDLSVSGVGLIVSRADRTMRPGNKISGLLRLPGGADLDLRLEIRHSRPLPGDREAVIVGCRALGLSPTEEAALKATLEGLRDIAD